MFYYPYEQNIYFCEVQLPIFMNQALVFYLKSQHQSEGQPHFLSFFVKQYHKVD